MDQVCKRCRRQKVCIIGNFWMCELCDAIGAEPESKPEQKQLSFGYDIIRYPDTDSDDAFDDVETVPF